MKIIYRQIIRCAKGSSPTKKLDHFEHTVEDAILNYQL